MAGEQSQRGYLSLTGLAVGYTVFAGVGYLAAGWWGAGCGALLLTILYARQIWRAVTPGGRCGVANPDAEGVPAPDPARDAGS